MVNDIPAGDGKMKTFFYSAHQPLSAPFWGLLIQHNRNCLRKDTHIYYIYYASNVRFKELTYTVIYYISILVMCTLRTLTISYTTSVF